MQRIELLARTGNRTDLEKTPFIANLLTAVHYVQRTCVFGSSNKIKDIRHTNGFITQLSYRYRKDGEYKKMPALLPIDPCTGATSDDSPNTGTNESAQTSNWYYQCYDMNQTTPRYRIIVTDLSHDPVSSMDGKLKFILVSAMYTQLKRYGNCGDKACLLTMYLWENCLGIHSIEIVPTDTFDHCYVVVNRQGNISDPRTWGDAWIIDPWYKNGIIFHASFFDPIIKTIKRYAKKQLDELVKIDLLTETNRYIDKPEIPKRVDPRIEPKRLRYPTKYFASSRSLEDSYLIENEYPTNFSSEKNVFTTLKKSKEAHKQQYQGCLFSINNLHSAVKHPNQCEQADNDAAKQTTSIRLP